MKKLSELLTFLTFDWYRKGPTDDMSNQKIIFGLILSIVIFLGSLTGTIGVLLRITGFIGPSTTTPSTTECLLGKWYYKDLNYNDGYNLKDAPIEVWDFQTNSTFIFEGNGYAWGSWKDIGNNKIEIIYSTNRTEDELSKKILSMPDCDSLQIGNKVFSNKYY